MSVPGDTRGTARGEAAQAAAQHACAEAADAAEEHSTVQRALARKIIAVSSGPAAAAAEAAPTAARAAAVPAKELAAEAAAEKGGRSAAALARCATPRRTALSKGRKEQELSRRAECSVSYVFCYRSFPQPDYSCNLTDDREYKSTHVRVLAYLPKTPGNFVHLFLDNGRWHAQSDTRYPIRIRLKTCLSHSFCKMMSR